MFRFKNGLHHQKYFKELVQLNADYEKKMKEGQKISNVSIHWNVGLDKISAFFMVENDGDLLLKPGDELRIRYMGDEQNLWSGVGHVTKVPNQFSNDVGIEMRSKQDVPISCNSNFQIEFIWKSTSFDRMQKALQKLALNNGSVSANIYHRILGHNEDDVLFKTHLPSCLSAPNLPKLDSSQVYAVKHALQRPLSLIQGPPGTGKTVTSATIVYQLVMQYGGPVLVCAPSNTAVDQVCEKVHKTTEGSELRSTRNLKVVRVYARYRETMETSVADVALHNQIMKLEGSSEIHRLKQLKEETGELSSSDNKR